MSIHDRDYVLRMIRQMVEALGRMFGLKKPPEETRRQIDETGQTLFGPLYATLRRADAKTAATLVSDRDKRWALAALLLEESKVAEALGAPRRAQGDLRTAAELLLELDATGPGLPEHAQETLRAVAGRLDGTVLPDEQRDALGRALRRSAPDEAG